MYFPGWLPDQGHLHISNGRTSHECQHRPRHSLQAAVLAGPSPWPQVARMATHNRLFLYYPPGLQFITFRLQCFSSSPICPPHTWTLQWLPQWAVHVTGGPLGVLLCPLLGSWASVYTVCLCHVAAGWSLNVLPHPCCLAAGGPLCVFYLLRLLDSRWVSPLESFKFFKVIFILYVEYVADTFICDHMPAVPREAKR